MPINIKSTKDVHVNGIKMVVFGYAGSGKTVLSSTAPKPIIISAEQGLLSLAGQDIPYIEVKSIKDIGESFNYLKSNNEFDTICIDSLSEITEVVITEFRKDVKDGRQAYMKLSEAMLPMIRNFRDLKGKNVVFTAKAKRVEDEYSGKTMIEPMLPGQVIPLNLPYLVDELIYMDMDKKGTRFLQCNPAFGVLVKDRSGKLADKEKPDLTYIFNKIIGKSL